MSLVDVRGYNFIPGMIARAGAYIGQSSALLDADGELCGGIFYISKTGNITKVGIRIHALTTTDTLKISIQGVNESNGRPDGVIAASGTLSTPAAYTVYWIELDSPLTVTMGDLKAVVVEWNDFVGEGSDGNLSISHRIQGFSYFGISIPYTFKYAGGAWTLYSQAPNFGLEYDDNIIEPILGCLPAVAYNSTSWDMNDNPDKRGLRFQVPYACRIKSAFFNADLDANANLILYDSDGVTALETISFDSDVRGVIHVNTYFAHFTSSKILVKDTYYRLVLLPTTGTNIILPYLIVTDDGANKTMNALDGGEYFHYTSCNGAPTQESDWAQTLTQRPIMGLVVDKLDDGVQPTESDVRSGTSYGESQTGSLDLPAISDVEKGVVFDSTTKTGTFKEPGITNVKLGIGYGAGDTEFTGTYVRNTVSGAEAEGIDTAGTVVGQDTAGTVVGE